MYFAVQFSVVRMDLYAMTPEERVAYLERRAADFVEKQKQDGWTENDNAPCPFPDWIMRIFETQSKNVHTDDLNAEVKIVFRNKRKADEAYANIKAAIEKKVGEDPAYSAWYKNNKMRASVIPVTQEALESDGDLAEGAEELNEAE